MPTTKKSLPKTIASKPRKKRSKKFAFKPAVHGPLAVALLVVLAVGFCAGINYSKEESKMLFTQQALTGSFRPSTTESGTYILTFLGVKPHTLIFSDKPHRVVGSWTNTDFVARWKTSATTSLDGVLLSHSTVDGKEYSLAVELMNPVFNAFAGTLTYKATIAATDADGLVISPDRHMEEFPEILRSPALFLDGAK
jgi:hypothetical protein